MIRSVLLFFNLCGWIGVLISGSLQGQNVLSLEKPGAYKRIHLQPGDSIGYCLDNQKEMYRGRIQIIYPEAVILSGDSIPISRFSSIILRKKDLGVYWIGNLGKALATAGIIYIPAAVANRNFYQLFPLLRMRDAFIAGGLLAGSAVTLSLSERRYRIGKKWQLQTLNIPFHFFR